MGNPKKGFSKVGGNPFARLVFLNLVVEFSCQAF